jgi:hypothetical protein
MDSNNRAGSRRFALMILAAAALAACATDSVVLVGAQRAPISPTDVKIYSKPPPAFDEIAILNASSNSMFTTGGQATVDKVIHGLKEQAAKLGANGIILEGFSDQATGSLGTGVGGTSVSGNSASSAGVGGSLGIYTKTGHGRAIYVPPESESH